MARVRKARLLIMSQTRPGVPDTTWTPFSSFLISSPKLFPPMQEWACTLMKSPIVRITFSVWAANSLVGDNTSACTLLTKKTLILVKYSSASATVSVKFYYRFLNGKNYGRLLIQWIVMTSREAMVIISGLTPGHTVWYNNPCHVPVRTHLLKIVR